MSDLEETYVRLAQTVLPDGSLVDREWTPAERYRLFARGFRDGAGTRGVRKECAGLGAYERGYAEGREATYKACADYAALVGYTPTVLR